MNDKGFQNATPEDRSNTLRPVNSTDMEKIDLLRASTVEAANTGGGLWYSYLFVLLYMLIAVSGVTHADLLTNKSVTLPFLNVDLPLLGFFWLAPLLLLISHVYVLLHFSIMRSKLEAFTTELLDKIHDVEEREFVRQQLPNSIFIQQLAGPREVRKGARRGLMLVISVVSLAVGPIFVLFLFLFQFLPYHNEGITWWHRLLVVADLILLMKLWPLAAMNVGRVSKKRQFFNLAATVLLCTMTVTDITFPGEWLDEHTFHLRFIPTAWPEPYGMARASHAEKEKKLEELCDTEFKAVQCPSSLTKFMRFANDLLASMEWISLHTLLLDGDVDLRTGKPISLFSNRLILPSYNNPGSSHFDPEKPDVADTTFSLRARNLQGAIFFNANLRGVDFTAANLRGALLARADLRGAKLGCASSQLNAAGGGNYIGTYADSHTDCTQLQGANFSSAMLQKTSIMGAVFSKTKFYGALLQEVDFSGADLHETDFSYADLSGARMMNATLTNSNMSDATIIGAYLQNAKAMGVNFSRAKLSLALLDGADLSGARFDNANLDGTSFIRVGGFDPVAWDNTWTVSLETLAHERLIAGIWLKAVCDSDYARVALEAVLPPLTSMVNGQHSVSDSPLLKNSELPHRLIERFRDPQKCNGARFFTDVQNKLLEDLANDEVGIRPYADILR